MFAIAGASLLARQIGRQTEGKAALGPGAVRNLIGHLNIIDPARPAELVDVPILEALTLGDDTPVAQECSVRAMRSPRMVRAVGSFAVAAERLDNAL